MNRSKWVAIATGAISLFLGVLYLLIVQFLDFRGEMIPAPIDISSNITGNPIGNLTRKTQTSETHLVTSANPKAIAIIGIVPTSATVKFPPNLPYQFS